MSGLMDATRPEARRYRNLPKEETLPGILEPGNGAPIGSEKGWAPAIRRLRRIATGPHPGRFGLFFNFLTFISRSGTTSLASLRNFYAAGESNLHPRGAESPTQTDRTVNFAR